MTQAIFAPTPDRTACGGHFERLSVLLGQPVDTDLALAGMVSAWVNEAASHGDRHEALSSSERWRVVRRAEDYLADRVDCTVRMDELCDAACTSLSRLERSFREVLGLSPRRYLMLRRMAAVRGELLAGKPGTTVTDAAMRCGFFHLGRFAEDYAALFSELPSQTLRSGSQRR